jgi:hypothetical protein
MDLKIREMGVVFALFAFLNRVVFFVLALDLTRPEAFIDTNHLTSTAHDLNPNKEQLALLISLYIRVNVSFPNCSTGVDALCAPWVSRLESVESVRF